MIAVEIFTTDPPQIGTPVTASQTPAQNLSRRKARILKKSLGNSLIFNNWIQILLSS